jgi:DNA-binding IclR family transcriptional regulator
MENDMVAQERAAIVAFALASGEQLTTQQIAERVGLTYSGAWRLLQKLARVCPITKDPTMDYWYSIQWYNH